jgi:hypothetical protein
MAQQGAPEDQKLDSGYTGARSDEVADPLDSGMRRKFLNFCRENPWAEECRIYEL